MISSTLKTRAAIHHPVLTLQVQHEYNDAVGRQGGS